MPTLTYSTCKNVSNTDWMYVDGAGESYNSYFLTGFKVHGQGQRLFQGNYLILYSFVEADASAFVRYRWDYAQAESTHRYSQEEQVYIDKPDYLYTTKRLWLRGQGLALQVHIRSDGNAPFRIIGYTMWETGNANP